jgi:hypothetical protein
MPFEDIELGARAAFYGAFLVTDDLFLQSLGGQGGFKICIGKIFFEQQVLNVLVEPVG